MVEQSHARDLLKHIAGLTEAYARIHLTHLDMANAHPLIIEREGGDGEDSTGHDNNG